MAPRPCRRTVALRCLLCLLALFPLLHSFPTKDDFFKNSSDFRVFTRSLGGFSYGVERCSHLENPSKLPPKLLFEYGIIQLHREVGKNVFKMRMKATLLRGKLSRHRSKLNLAILNGDSGDIVYQHTQNLYAQSDVMVVLNNKDILKTDPGSVEHFDVYLHLDMSALPATPPIHLSPGDKYLVELQLTEREKSRDCVHLAAVYSGLHSDCPSFNTSESSPIVQHNEYITNIYQVSENSSTFARHNVLLFGAKGDGNTDDTLPIARAIEAASETGSTVYFPAGRYRTTAPLDIPAGVSMRGEGQGDNPRNMGSMVGSVIMYRGLDYAVRVQGDLVSISDLAVYDAGLLGGSASGGILIDASAGRFIESVRMSGVLIYRFTNGTGLQLLADNGGAIAYSSFYDIRVRNAKVGIHIRATGAGGSFANSNSFYRGAISGGGFDYCLLLEGPGPNNNNDFFGTVMEPYESAVAHIHVSGLMTQMAGHHIRVEALQQPTRRPMIYFAPETYGSSLSGLFSAGLIDMNRMAHQVDIKTGKFVGSTPSNHNQYLNAAFRNVQQSTGSVTDIPFWITTVSPSAAASRLNVTVANELQILEDHNVLRLQIPPQTTLRLKALEHPQPKRAALYRGVAFGMYVRYVTVPADWSVSKIYATFDTSQTSVTTSLVHPAASTDWHFVSMRGDLPASSASAGSVAIYTEFVFENMDSMESLCVEITLPSFAWGEQTPQLESTPLSSAGGKMFGTLSTSAVSVLPPASGNYYVFPKDGNVYIIASTAHIYPTMSRLNYAGAERFAEGTVITILFLVSGVTIADGPYIDIISSFTSNSHCSITLLARDAGTWIELSRSGIA